MIVNEETIKMLNIINNKIKKCKKDNNVNTLLAIPLGSHGEFGYLTDKMLNEVIAIQQENAQLKEDIKNIINILRKNCDDLEATEEEFESLYKWQNE